jgi:response regulator RpfG family c-di-GMP phosphodiesterase
MREYCYAEKRISKSMIGKVSERLLKDGRDTILFRAVMTIQPDTARDLRESGLDAREVLCGLLDCFAADYAGEDASGLPQEAAFRFTNSNLPWKSISQIVQALGRCIFEYIAEKGEQVQLDRLYQEMIVVQSALFEKYLEREKDKHERLGKYQREIDRFPDTIAATLDPPTLAKIGLKRLKELIEVEECTLFLVNSKHGLVPQFGDHVRATSSSTSFSLEPEAARQLFDSGEPYLEDSGLEGSCIKDLRSEFGLSSVLLLPMVVRGRTTGIILLSDGVAKRYFGPDEIEIAASFSNRLAVAMENARLHSKEQRKIKETVALLEIARAVNSTLDLHEILDKAVQMTVDLCGVVMCVIYLLDSENGRFIPGAYYGFIDDSLWSEERASGFDVSLLQKELTTMLERGKPVIIPSHNQNYLMPSDVIYEHGVNLVLMLPLSSRENLTGVFTLFYPHRVSELEREEIEVVGAIAAQASIAIENAALYEDIEKSYFSTVKALAKAIEVKDPYTHGHSERVTEYALMIAEAMELNERDKQKLKYAATLHDIGKIGIAGRVLNKAGALTDEEYMHVKTHPLLGDTIIEPVEFLQGPRPIILHHHERYDGKGYPGGLKGTDIPLCARILSVADAFEAMRSDRPYRRALPLETALEELSSNAGTQFDPDVVAAFISILESGKGDPVNI